MLIPRPSTVAPTPSATTGRPTDAGDPLRERLAQVEVQSAATRSIATRIEGEATRANIRIDAIDPRIATIEAGVRERITQLGQAIDSTRETLLARVEELVSARARTTVPFEDTSELAGLKTTIATMRQLLLEHDRQFEARRARVESLETRVTGVEADPRVIDLRRAVESFDLRLRALERSQETLRTDVEARVAAMEARRAEPPPTPTKKATPEPELRRIKGVGPKYEKALREVGITTIAQVADMGDDELTRVAAQLSVPVERIRKLGWPEIARTLLAVPSD